MRNIAVFVEFTDETCRRMIDEAAGKAGFTVRYFDGPAALAPYIGEFEVLYGHPAPELLRRAKSLKWLCSDFAGVDRYLDDSAWPHPGCLLSNGSGAYGPAISEHVVMVLLMLLRRMPEYSADLAQRRWTYHSPIRSILGSEIVMLGTGDIGRHTARRLKALGAGVTGVCRSGRSGEPAFDRVLPVSELDSVLPQADALVMALPSTPHTAGILSRERIALLPPQAYVINVGRGAAVDQEALAEALRARRIAGAALDVLVQEPLPAEDPLWDCPNLLITPHTSGNMSLGLTCRLNVEMFCGDLARYAAGEPLVHQVDRAKGY